MNADIGSIFSTDDTGAVVAGTSSQNALLVQMTYAPFFISGDDSSDLRYTLMPDAGAVTQEIQYYIADDGTADDLHMPKVETDFLAGGAERVTEFSDYDDHGQPGLTEVFIEQAGSSTLTPADGSGLHRRLEQRRAGHVHAV